jgi:hypothetical protein
MHENTSQLKRQARFNEGLPSPASQHGKRGRPGFLYDCKKNPELG